MVLVVGSDFNYDFHVTLDEAVAPVEYNYRSKAELIQKGEAYFTQGEAHGLSVFLPDGDSMFHTYSTYARGTDLLAGTSHLTSTSHRSAGRRTGRNQPAAAIAHSWGGCGTMIAMRMARTSRPPAASQDRSTHEPLIVAVRSL